MTKARQLADLGNAYDDGALSNRNLIINGAMQVAQRGTSFSHNGVVGRYPVDRMNVAIYTSGWSSATGGTSSQVSITDTFNETVNFTKAVRLTPSSDWGRAHWFCKIEGVEFLSAKTVTLSFWARVNTGTLTLSNSNGTGDTRFDQQFGSGGSSVVIQEVNPNITISTSWQKFTITHTFASTNGKTIGASPYINATILNDVDLSSVGWLEMTGVQLEVGDTATPFEHRSYGDELAKCQRYYQKFPGALQIPGYQDGTSGINASLKLNPNMRAVTPSTDTDGSVYIWRHNGFQSQNNPAITVSTSTINGASLTLNVGGWSGCVNGYVANLYISNLEIINEL